jgi:hypothetical protein
MIISMQGVEVTVTASPCPFMSEDEHLWTSSGRKRDKPKLESIANNIAAQMAHPLIQTTPPFALVTHAFRCSTH